MLNNVLENIATRTSVRSFSDKIISEETIQILLKAAMAAPSAKNIQPWEFIVVTDRGVLNTLADNLRYAKMLYEAPLGIVVLGHPDGAPYWQHDAAAATENILLAAHSLGLGAVWTAACGDDRAEAVERILGVPEGVSSFCVIPIGYPQKIHIPKNKWNVDKIHFNKW